MTDRAFEDRSLPIDVRVEDLLARMSVEDKVGLLFHTFARSGTLDEGVPPFGIPSIRSMIVERGMTHFAVIGAPSDGRAYAEWHNAVQRLAADQPLGIPVTLSCDPVHHFNENPATSWRAPAFSQWPEPLGLGAIGSEEVVSTFADIARQEYVAVGLRAALHPQIDVATEPRWTRVGGTFGEDAALASRLGAAYVRGFQGEHFGPGSVSMMAKHFPGGGPQKGGDDPHFAWGREQVYPGGRFDYHLEPFQAAIEAGVRQIMPYYGMPSGTVYEEVGFGFNRSIITGILRDKLGFGGIVCTDWGLVTDWPGAGPLNPARAWGVEHLSREERILKILGAGVDQLGGEHCTEILVALVERSDVPQARIDDSARRLLREKFALGLFDDRYVDAEAAARVVGSPEFRAAGLRSQQAALTLLTNAATTPVTRRLPLRRGIRVYAEGANEVLLAEYATVVSDPTDAEVAIVRLEAPHDDERVGRFHAGSLEFPAGVIERVRSLSAAVPLVIDVYLDRPAILTPLVELASAAVVNFGIAEAALYEVLFGVEEPQGHLPIDLPRSAGAVAASRTDVPFDTENPLFCFGHGLRY